MHPNSYFRFVVVAVLPFLSQAYARECGLSIAVLDSRTISEMPYRIYSFKSRVGGDEAGRFKNRKADGLACGTYTYELRRSDVETSLGAIRGQIVLSDSRQHLTLEADPNLLITKEGALVGDR